MRMQFRMPHVHIDPMRAFVFVLLLVGGARPTAVTAQAANPSVIPEITALSPRTSVLGFLEAARLGRYEEAANFLEPAATGEAQSADRAAHVKAVLDRHLWVDVESLSTDAQGNLDDGLRPNLEEIGRIEVRKGVQLPVRLTRVSDDPSVGWQFARGTVAALDAMYQAMPDRLILEIVPRRLLRMGPADLMWWQWLALPLVGLLCVAFGLFFGWVTRRIFTHVARRTEASWDDALVARMRGPLALLWAMGLGYLAIPYLVLAVPVEEKLNVLMRTGAIFAVFWSALRSVDLASDVLIGSSAMQTRSAQALLPVLSRIVKVGVLAMLVVAVLSGLGLPVTSLIAGLGVGGIALALAAQKTVENVFGAVSIGVDVPFEVGNFVKVDGIVGTVETVGLRSTRIRTLDRTLVTMPNGGLADARIESYTARDRIRLAATIGLEYGTTRVQMEAVLAQVEAALRAHPSIWPDAVVVRFVGFGASSLDIDIMAWFLTQDWNEFQGFRQQMLLEIMAIVERNGTSFAFPTQTVHVLRQEPPAL